MTEKYADQYVDELEIYFPEIEKERRMVKSLTGELSSYMRVWYGSPYGQRNLSGKW
jgi:hypothetical protein